MGRICAIVLLLAACGDNEKPGTPANLAEQPAGVGGAVQPGTREVPAVCGDLQWSSTGVSTMDMKLSVAPGPTGFAILGVPSAGGTLEGFVLDNTNKDTGLVTSVPISESFSAVGMSRINGRLVSAGVDGSIVQINLLDDTLQNPISIGKLQGSWIAAPAMLLADGLRVVPLASNTGVIVQQFDQAWQPTSSLALATTTEAPIGFTAAQLGAAMVVGWSTSTQCFLSMVYAPTAGTVGHVDFPCAAPRLAANLNDGSATLVFEAPDGVRYLNASTLQAAGVSQLMRGAGATSPRVMFDGTRLWVTYIDERGDIIAGILHDNQLVSTEIAGTRPAHDAYDIAMFDGSPWVFALDANGYSAHRMCVTQQ